jgi:poly(3-hydroxybutyrate) depolymerase
MKTNLRCLSGSKMRMKTFTISVLITVLTLAIAIVIVLGLVTEEVSDIYPNQRIGVDGSERTYRLVVPKSDAKTPWPVVVAFHGVGDTPEAMANYSSLDSLATHHGFILVYPAGRNLSWQTSGIEREIIDSHPDVRFFEALIESLKEQYTIDSDRIYVVGMSNGATFAQILAASKSDIAAVVAHSGPAPTGFVDHSAQTFPIMLIVGEQDRSKSRMAADANEYRDSGHVVEFDVVPGSGHTWSTAHNQAMWEFLSRHRRGG